MIAQWLPTLPNLPFLAATPPAGQQSASHLLWMLSAIFLLVVLAVAGTYGYLRLRKMRKALNFEEYKNRDLKKKLKMALVTIRKMEMSPDLIYARGFNLDYLRMRMDEEVFHYIVVNQIKMKITQLIGEALRPNTANYTVGMVGGARQIEETFDVTYEVETQQGKWNKGVLFRVQIYLSKLPTQSSSATISQLVKCIERFLSPNSQHNWQPTLNGHLVHIDWDQKAKPTPLLVMKQLEEGINATSAKGRSQLPMAWIMDS